MSIVLFTKERTLCLNVAFFSPFVFVPSMTCDLREIVGVTITSLTLKQKRIGSYIHAGTGVLTGSM
jgi:hypothetical protein